MFAAAASAQDGANAAQTDSAITSGDIIVTARKRDERLIDVPVAVTAFGQEALENADITSPVELSDYTPGLDFQQAGAGTDGGGSNPNVTFRGIRQQLSTTSNQVGAIFWNGSFMGAGAGILPIETLSALKSSRDRKRRISAATPLPAR